MYGEDLLARVTMHPSKDSGCCWCRKVKPGSLLPQPLRILLSNVNSILMFMVINLFIVPFIRGVMSPAPDSDPESESQLFGNSESSKNQNHNTYRGVMIPYLDPDLSKIFSLLAIPDPDSDPLKSGIVTPLPSITRKRNSSV